MKIFLAQTEVMDWDGSACQDNYTGKINQLQFKKSNRKSFDGSAFDRIKVRQRNTLFHGNCLWAPSYADNAKLCG